MMESGEERTEEATPKRREKLREEGKVAQSPDVAAALVLVGLTGVLSLSARELGLDLAIFSDRIFRLRDVGRPLQALDAMLGAATAYAVPLVAASLLAAFAGVAQTRTFSFGLLAPRAERLDPLPRLKNLLPGRESLLEIAKQLLKLTAIGVVVGLLLTRAASRFAVLARSETRAAAALVAGVAGEIALYGGLAFALVAALDFWLVHRRFQSESKMSRHELRDERKEDEGDPRLRQRLRRRMRELTRVRTVAVVRQATVLVTNPTHVAVALRYEPGRDHAPVLLSKGIDEVALRMRREARAHGIPIHEQRTLARALWRDGRRGRPIPVALYRATAEVLAHVLRLRAGASVVEPRP